MSFNKEDTVINTIDEDYDMVPINTYSKAMNNYRMFAHFKGQEGQYANNYFSPQFKFNNLANDEIKPMTYYKVDHNLMDDNLKKEYDFRNTNLEDNYGMKMMEEDDKYSNDKSREVDYDDFVDVNKILIKIERYNPGIFQFMRRYGMSYEDAKRIIKKIITLTLMYEND